MNRSLGIGLVVGAVVATAGGAVAGFKLFDQPAASAAVTEAAPPAPAAIEPEPVPVIEEPTHADVLDVTRVTRTVSVPRQVCYTETVTRQAPPQDENRVAGTVSGAVVGGVLGNQVGGGDGRKIATAAGAAAGGYAGNRIQQRIQQGNTYTTNEQRCSTVYDSRQEQVGFDVRYRLGDEEGQVRMAYHPGDRIPVRDGELIVDVPTKSER